MFAAIILGFTACSGTFGPGTGPNDPNNQNPVGPGAPDGGPVNGIANDPAEQAAVELIKSYGGYATQEGGRVVAVGVFNPSFNDDHLKQLAPLTKE
jgi:hypothetical protein